MVDKKPDKPKPKPTNPYPGISNISKRGEGKIRESDRPPAPKRPQK